MTTEIDYEATGPNYAAEKLLDVRERVHQAIAAVSAKIEGLYYDMGTLTAAFTCPSSGAMCTPGYAENGTFAIKGTIWRAGLNWHFH